MSTAVFRYRYIVGVTLLAASLGACQITPSAPDTAAAAGVTDQPEVATAVAGGDQNAATERPKFEQFDDVPVPQNARLDLERSLILGSRDGWIGRLVYGAPFSMTQMFVFFEQEMLRFGWQPLTAVRAAISTLSFQRGNRIATIILEQRITGGATVSMTMAPAAVSGGVPAQ